LKPGGVCASTVDAQNSARNSMNMRAIDAQSKSSPNLLIFVITSSLFHFRPGRLPKSGYAHPVNHSEKPQR
jgi:hypothetical protein